MLYSFEIVEILKFVTRRTKKKTARSEQSFRTLH